MKDCLKVFIWNTSINSNQLMLVFPKSNLTIYLPSGISEIFYQMVKIRRRSNCYCVKLRIGVWTNQSENFLPTANDRKAGFWTNQEKEREI